MTSFTSIASTVRHIRSSAAEWRQVEVRVQDKMIVAFSYENALFLVSSNALDGKTIKVWGQDISCVAGGCVLILKDGPQANWGIDPVASQLKLQLRSEAKKKATTVAPQQAQVPAYASEQAPLPKNYDAEALRRNNAHAQANAFWNRVNK